MKKFTYTISLAILLAGCNEVNHAKLSYQAKECFADNSVSCNDIRVQKAIVATKLFRKQLIEEKQRAVTEIGKEGYQELLLLVDQKIEYLKKQRPNLYLRWFQRDSRYYKDVDFGDHIDVEIEKLIDAKDTTRLPIPNPAELIQDGEPIRVASEQNQTEHFSEEYRHSYTFTVVEPVLTGDYDLLLNTQTGPVKFDLHYTSVAQNFILEKLKKGDCIHFSAKETPVMNVEHQLYFETYITDPQIVQCN
ncbi:lipoprotein [Acinetobacter sp. NIPH 298]|uniref:lipoprotein n=1 Tax=Acinetobacter sp. NIPH 298 TaxID=1217692 RepID=UPI0002CEC852|nr:lipoprotein [Acinetobacter sp. NIPH 298]ENW96010.1 hypothetical protein F903_01779 [Acinetobacter sp. NIPH 298]